MTANRTQDETTRERILRAAIDRIEKDGAGRATIRAIAAEAGVNVAAINYHYRTKEDLMNAAIESTWQHALGDLRGFLQTEPRSISEGLEALALYLLRGGRQYPNVTRAHLLGSAGLPAPAAVLSSQKAFIAEVARTVSSAVGIPCDDRLVVRTGIFYSYCLYSALSPASLPDVMSGDDFSTSAGILVSDYLANVTGSSPRPVQ